MGTVANCGFSADTSQVDIVDDLVLRYIRDRQWPRLERPDANWQACIQERLIGIGNDCRAFVLVKGAVLSVVWPSFSPVVRSYWRHLASETRKGDRFAKSSFSAESNWPPELWDWLASLIVWHGWYGPTLHRNSDGSIEVSLPLYMARCLESGDFEEFVAGVPETWKVFEDRPMESAVTRSLADVRRVHTCALAGEIAAELRNPVLPPSSGPEWLRAMTMDFVQEADAALGAGAVLPAVVAYGAAAESVLAGRFGAVVPHGTTPAEAGRRELRADFSVAGLLDKARLGLPDCPQLLARLELLRKQRNGIHGNQYATCSAMLGPVDAIEYRRCVRELALRLWSD